MQYFYPPMLIMLFVLHASFEQCDTPLRCQHEEPPSNGDEPRVVKKDLFYV